MRNEAKIAAAEHLLEKLKRQSKDSLSKFISFTYNDYIWNWHHKYVCRVLEKFVRGEIKKLAVFMPPQHGKSEIVSRRLPAYLLGRNPKIKIAGCSYSADLARKFNRSVQRIIDGNEYYSIFPDTTLYGIKTRGDSKGSWLRNTDEFEIVEHGGSYKSVGVMGALTGNTVDVAIIDDPIKDAAEANSDRIRNTIWEWYTNVLLTRLHNDSQILLTMTRWHEDDLAGRLLKRNPDEWKVLSIPAIKENDEDPNDPREIGEPLWPERHSKEKILSAKKLNPITFSSLMQQRPAPEEGGIIKPDDWFEVANDSYDHLPVHYTVDTSYTADKRNDPTAIMAYHKLRNGIVIKRCVARHVEFNDLCHFIVEFCNGTGYSNQSIVKIEPMASGKSVVQELQRRTNLNVVEAPSPGESKVTRARVKAGYMASGRVKVLNGSYVDQFFTELKNFPNGAHDDMVDCLLMAIYDTDRQTNDIIWSDDFK